MQAGFTDRFEAGRRLAELLDDYRDRPDVTVLGLPRGGVPVAYEVSRQLGAPLDVFVVRKLGVPGHEELAMGALAAGNVRVINRQLQRRAGARRRAADRAKDDARRPSALPAGARSLAHGYEQVPGVSNREQEEDGYDRYEPAQRVLVVAEDEQDADRDEAEIGEPAQTEPVEDEEQSQGAALPYPGDHARRRDHHGAGADGEQVDPGSRGSRGRDREEQRDEEQEGEVRQRDSGQPAHLGLGDDRPQVDRQADEEQTRQRGGSTSGDQV